MGKKVVANKEVEPELIEEATQEEATPQKVTFYCQEYKDLSMDITSPKCDTINGKKIFTQGKSVKFHDHQLETDDQEVIGHVRGHVWYGIKIIEQGA